MFKMLILQHYYNLPEDNMEFRILDRMSFRRFSGVDLAHDIPDSKTIWLFKERSGKEDRVKPLFDHFKSLLEAEGMSFDTAPAKGFAASENLHFSGYKLQGICSANGIFHSIELTKANIHDTTFLKDFNTQPAHWVLPGAKGVSFFLTPVSPFPNG